MHILKSSSFSSISRFLNSPLKPKSFVFLHYYSSSSTLISNSPLLHYLVKDLDFSESQALSISNRSCSEKHLEKAQSVAKYFQSLGFSNAHIASVARIAPQILFANVERNLRPKIKIFQDLGLEGTHLGKFISKNSALLTCSLDKKLIPSIQMVKKVLGDSDNKDNLIRIFNRCNGFIARDGMSKLLRNIKYLESYGIVGSQLSRLLTRQPRIFRMNESAITELVSKVLDMGFSTDSRMLVHYIHTLNCMSEKTFRKKWELFKSLGFSEKDCVNIFRRAPGVFRASEEKIMLGIEFFMNVMKFDRTVLVAKPCLLMRSLEDRVIPRYRVLQIIKSKKLLKKEPSFIYIVDFTEDQFLNFMSRFTDNVEELLIAYKAHLVDTSSSEEES